MAEQNGARIDDSAHSCDMTKSHIAMRAKCHDSADAWIAAPGIMSLCLIPPRIGIAENANARNLARVRDTLQEGRELTITG
jgi:hypothetical protein